MRLGKDLQHIAQVLHIRYTYLVAIEDGRYEDLPGQAYAIGFVRAYADHLDLDGDEIVRRYKEESSGLQRKAALDFPIPTPDSGIPSGVALLGAMVFGIAVYGTWYAVSGPSRSFPLVQDVPSRLMTKPPEVQVAEPVEEPVAEDTGEDSEAPETPNEPEPMMAEPEPDALVDPGTSVAPTAPADVLELRATTDSWIQVRNGDVLMLTRLLRKGEVYRVPEQKGLTLMTGNAGGVEVLVNGEVMPPLGAPGAVASGIPLDPAHFKGQGGAAASVAPR
jgi:cytoskeleton protein RodZ